MKNKIAILTITLALTLTQSVRAGYGTSSLDFMNIGISARSAGTGGALSALSEGPVSAYYNPAGLAGVNGFQIAGMHSEWYQDMRYEYLGMAHPLGQNAAIGLSASYLGYGDIQGYSAANVPTGGVDASDWSFGLSYGRNLTTALSLGTGIKVLGEKLVETSARGFAGDIGMQYRSGRYGAGLALLNLGPNIKYQSASSPLPTKVNACFSYYPMGADLALLAGMELPFQGGFGLRTGLEYTYSGILTLRSGYDSGRRVEGQGGLSFGAGFNISDNSLDYAYNVNSVFGGTHQLTFTIRLAHSEKAISYAQVPLTQSESGVVRSDSKKKTVYLVCAARYGARADAEKHVESLKLFGYKPWIQVKAENDFLVVLAKSDKLPKAEKMKNEFKQKGISSFIEVE